MQARLLPLLTAATLLAITPQTRADEVTANNPLTPPLFSIDPNSPEVDPNLPYPLHPGDLLVVEPNVPMPTIAVFAENLSLDPNDPRDNVNGLALQAWVSPGETFVLIFSVDRAAIGAAPPDPYIESLGFPYNAQDQAGKGQAAGDAYMSLLLFDSNGPVPPPPWQSGQTWGMNNTLVVNQGDAGGVDFRLGPNASPDPNTPPPNSDADAGSGTQPQPWPAAPGGGPPRQPPPEWLLFSLARGSPSLSTLPGTGSGADIYIDWDPNAPGGEDLYVPGFELGLFYEDDDISAMIVFEDGDGIFTPGVDQVIFSMDPDSPSLVPLPDRGPGDLFTSKGGGTFEPYCMAEEIGLEPTDNLNMLDFVPCEHVLSCVYDWAIGHVGSCEGDINGDGQIDAADLSILLSAYGTCEGDPDYYPGADLTDDGCVSLADLATLLAHYGQPCE